MIRCQKCKRVTEAREPTGLFVTYKTWRDEKGKLRKDTVHVKKTCIHCHGETISR